MRRNYLILAVLVVGCVCLLQTGCQSGGRLTAEQAETAGESKPDLTVSKPVFSPAKAKTRPEAVTAPKVREPAPRIRFEKVVHNFGKIGPRTRQSCKFEFTNVGDGVLKIGKIKSTCGCTVPKLSKVKYAPGESGTVTVKYHVGARPGLTSKRLYVPSNDKTRPKVSLTIKAEIVLKVDYQPKRLNLSLKKENAGCPDITLRSLDEQPFAIKSFKAIANCITVDYDPAVKAAEFVLKPKVDIEKLRKGLKGHIEIKLTHPECKTVTIIVDAMAEFAIQPASINILKAKPNVTRQKRIWVLNNYGEDFEIESVASKKGSIKVLSQEKIGKRYKLELEITPPAIEYKTKMFMDVLSVKIKGGRKLESTCRVFYEIKSKSQPKRTTRARKSATSIRRARKAAETSKRPRTDTAPSRK